jgi:2',3'-cyclic-nucleotide 2'-phosphodiesterase (5'-nucleotidase family)
LDHDIVPSDPAVATLVHALRQPYRDRLDAPVGMTTEVIPRAQTLAGPHPRIRDAESPVDSLFADILRKELRVEIVFLPGVGYGVALGPGMVTAEALRNMLPHDSQMVTMMLTGVQLREILEQAVDNVVTDDPDKKVGGMIQVSGMTFAYNPAKPYPDRVQRVHVQGQALRSDGVYQVAANSLLAGGGHRYRTFLAGQDRQERGNQYELVKEWFSRQRTIQAPPPGRIQVVP